MLLNKIITLLSMKDNKTCNSLNIFLLQNMGKISHINIFKENIIDNEFIDGEEIKIIENYYIKAKKHYDSLNSFLHRWKYKKYVNYDYDKDLYLTPLSEFKDIHKIVLLENKTKYHFRLSDLVNSWLTCLRNNDGLFPKPIELKNPHTNLSFSTHNLFNIYFKLLETKFNIPYLINCFFICEMRITLFTLKYLPILKDIAIYNFSKSDNAAEKWEQILNMLHKYRKEIDYLTFSNFVEPEDKINIIDNLDHIIIHYLNSEYSCNPFIKDESDKKTKELIKKYIDENPNLGYDNDDNGIVIRYVPYNERRNQQRTRLNPPPVPSNIRQRILNRRPTQSPPPPPPPPPATEGTQSTSSLSDNINSILLPPPPPLITFSSDDDEIIETPNLSRSIINNLASSRRRRYRTRSRTIRFPRLNPLFQTTLNDEDNTDNPDNSSSDESSTTVVSIINPFEINFDMPDDPVINNENSLNSINTSLETVDETHEPDELQPLLSNETQETTTQETTTQETTTQETTTQETTTQETRTQETTTQETTTQETKTQETTTQETRTQETRTQETTTQETKTQETETQETETQENQTETIHDIENQINRLQNSIERLENELINDNQSDHLESNIDSIEEITEAANIAIAAANLAAEMASDITERVLTTTNNIRNTPVRNTPVTNTPVTNTPVRNTPVRNTPVRNTNRLNYTRNIIASTNIRNANSRLRRRRTTRNINYSVITNPFIPQNEISRSPVNDSRRRR